MMALREMKSLAARPKSVADARAFVALLLHNADLDSLVEDGELIVSELITNAITALSEARAKLLDLGLPPHLLGRRVHLHCCVITGMVLLGVEGQTLSLPTPREAIDDEESGRGLMIVEALAKDWGYTKLTGGDVATLLVYAALARPVLPTRRWRPPAQWKLETDFVVENLLGFRSAPSAAAQEPCGVG